MFELLKVETYHVLHDWCSFQEAPPLGDLVTWFKLGPVTPRLELEVPAPPVAEPRRHLHLCVHLQAETAQKESVPEEAVTPRTTAPFPIHLKKDTKAL